MILNFILNTVKEHNLLFKNDIKDFVLVFKLKLHAIKFLNRKRAKKDLQRTIYFSYK
jgi:hypothetical protein